MWLAARPFTDAAAIAHAVEVAVDADLLVAAAIEQWVAPLVWRGLTTAGCQARLGGAAAALRANAALGAARAHWLPGALDRAITPLTAVGLEPVVLKGGTLAGRYPDPGLRPMGDLDLLISPRDHTTGIAALERAGWRMTRPADRLRPEATLVHADVPALCLELHMALHRWWERETRLRSAPLWDRRRPSVLMGTPAFSLEPEDDLLMIATHAGKPYHCFDRLLWSVDLVVTIEWATSHGGLDWDTVCRRAAEARCSTVLAVALTQARRLGACVPGRVLEALPADGWRHGVLAPLLDREWPLQKPDPTSRHRVPYALCQTWPRRLLLLLGETAAAPWYRQPRLIGERAWTAARGLPRLQRRGGRRATR